MLVKKIAMLPLSILALALISALVAPAEIVSTTTTNFAGRELPVDIGSPLGKDPVYRIVFNSPTNGSVVTLPFKPSLEMIVTSFERYTALYAETLVCIEVLESVIWCKPVLDPQIVFDELPEGLHTARAFLTDDGGITRRHVTDAVLFSVLNADDYASYVANFVEETRVRLDISKDENLLEWAQQQNMLRSELSSVSLPSTNSSDPVLVIGVKTAVLTSFARRQAIRETWGQRVKLNQIQVKLVFLGCVPILSDIQEEADRQRLQDAVNMEKLVYRDLLTEELECEDSYRGLADKVKSFFHLTMTSFPRTTYIMLTDDDVYVRVDELIKKLNELNQPKRLYVGQAWKSMFSSASTPVRDETHRNYLPTEQYLMSKLPPFAFGPHYVVSMDCARYISKNHWRLQSLNGLEDVSVGLWMLTMQVHLQHTHLFAHLTLQPCKDYLISFAEVSPLGVRAIHANLLHGRGFCHRYDRTAWTSESVAASIRT